MDPQATAERDSAEVVRVAILIVGLAINAYILWDYISERTEVLIFRRRLSEWWEQRTAKAKALCRAEIEVVNEATRVVEGRT